MFYYGAPPNDPSVMYAVSSRVLDTNDLPYGPSNRSDSWNMQDGHISEYQPLLALLKHAQQYLHWFSNV